MCITKLLKHPECGHWSCEIKEPCKEGRDFSNCPSFKNGIARNPAIYPQETAKEKTCPKCDKKDDYDGKKTRMIKKTVHATKIGYGPNVSYHLQASPPYFLHFELRDSRDLFRDSNSQFTRDILTLSFSGRTAGLTSGGKPRGMGQRRNQKRYH